MKILENVSLAHFCTFGIGGDAKFLVNIKSKDDLIAALTFAKQQGLPTFVLGGGSNILLPDEGINGVVLRMMNNNIVNTNQEIEIESGANWTKIMSYCKQNGIFGMETFSGLPGSMGGAIFGNAGCHGVETKDLLLKIEILDIKSGEFRWIDANDVEFDYRYSEFKRKPDWIIWSCTMKISKNSEDATADPKKLYEFRQERQPQGLTTGSFFKNPEGNAAGQLIDQCGLKGLKKGNVEVSTKHANFFMNLGGATARDVDELALEVQKVVEDKTGVCLEKEVLKIDQNGEFV
jgi:UDP-N-acetylmuramate dehydrogenase